MALKEASIGEAQSDSIQGAGIHGQLFAAVGTAKEFFDLTAWKGRLIIINITGDAHYRFAHATGDALDVTTEAMSADAPGATIAGRLVSGESHRSVPVPTPSATPGASDARVGMLIAAVAGTIEVRIHPG